MKDKLATQQGKEEVIRMLWNRVLFNLFKKSMELKDDNMKEIVKRITETPLNVTDELIKRYVKKCKEKHAIAFI